MKNFGFVKYAVSTVFFQEKLMSVALKVVKIARFEIHQTQLQVPELPLGQGHLLHLHRYGLPLQYPEPDSLVHELCVLLPAHNPIPRPHSYGSLSRQRSL